MDIDIGEGPAVKHLPDPGKNKPEETKVMEDSSKKHMGDETETEEDYFTKSDTVIGRERKSKETSYPTDQYEVSSAIPVILNLSETSSPPQDVSASHRK